MKKLLICVMVMTPFILTSCGDGTPGTGYSGADLTGKVEVTRDKATKAATLTVNDEGAWEIYAGPSVDAIDMKSPVLRGDSPGIYPLDVPVTGRSYFQFVQGNNRAILAERHLPMEGGYNFRDLGGFRNKDGYYVKWGMIFRSDDLYNLTDKDLAYLASIPLVSVVDFRSEGEVGAAPDKLPAGAAGHSLSISPGDMTDAANYASASPEQMAEFMREMNIMLVSDPHFVAQYREFFRLLQDEGSVPLMFHCSAGKDRTGMGAALVLSALGVDEETILRDYESSNYYLGDKYAPLIGEMPNLEPMMTVDRSYLIAGMERIKSDHGSVENFLRGELGVNIEEFRRKYLY